MRGMRRARRVAAMLLSVAGPLAGCAMSDDNLARTLVAPGRYTLYTCPELATEAKNLASRQHALEGLMARAGSGVGGDIVNATAYRPEYLSNRGLLRDVREEGATKNCDPATIDKAIAEGQAAPPGESSAAPSPRAPSPLR